MSRLARIERAGDAAVIVTEALGAEAARLQADGERLRAAAHPGVIRVVSSEGDDERWELRTAPVGRPLDVVPRLTPEALASVAATVATTLADLHQIGIVHGGLRAAHIVIGESGRPVLSGFSADPERAAADPADDVAALGQIIHDHLAGEQAPEPIPERRWSRPRRWAGWARSTLLTLADQACADPPSRRPSARRFAGAIADAFDVDPIEIRTPIGASADDASSTVDDPIERLRLSADAPPPDAAGRRTIGLIATVVGLALLVHAMNRAPSTAEVSTDRAPRDHSNLTSTTPDAQPTPQPEAPGAVGPTPAEPRRCPGSVCATELQARVEGTMVTTTAGRFQVGRPGDQVAIGDWDCDGTATPAVLRPGTGEVFVFDGWSGDAELAVRALRTIPDAASLAPVQLDGGCAALHVQLTDGTRVPVIGVAS